MNKKHREDVTCCLQQLEENCGQVLLPDTDTLCVPVYPYIIEKNNSVVYRGHTHTDNN